MPIIRLDNLTDDERKAYTLVHNKLTMNSGFDFATLDLELEDIDIDMSKFGFDTELEGFNADDFFEDAEPKEKEPKTVTCPNCGEEIEV